MIQFQEPLFVEGRKYFSVVQIDGLRLLWDAHVLRLLFWFRVCADSCGTNTGFERNDWLFLFWIYVLLESSCSLKFSSRLGEVKVGLSPSKKVCVICLIESPLKMMRNAFYFNFKGLFFLKIFKFLSRRFVHVGKLAWLEI